MKELVWFTEKYSKISLFRLGNGFSKSEREFVNPCLDTIQMNYAGSALECEWMDMSLDVDMVSDKYVSFIEYYSVYCGGAHPGYNTEGYNFDLKNKVQLGKLTDVYPDIDIYQLLKKKYENDTDLDEEWRYFCGDNDVWEYSSWVFTENGVAIIPSFPHAMTPCEIEFDLTYEELQKGY